MQHGLNFYDGREVTVLPSPLPPLQQTSPLQQTTTQNTNQTSTSMSSSTTIAETATSSKATSTSSASAVIKSLSIPMHPVSSVEVAELTKIVENAHRYLQIAFAEELYLYCCLLYTSPSPRDGLLSRMPSSA